MLDTTPTNTDPEFRRMPRLFLGLFTATYLVALLPPVYIGMTRLHNAIFGLPVSVWYMFLVCAFAVVLCGLLYAHERGREELD